MYRIRSNLRIFQFGLIKPEVTPSDLWQWPRNGTKSISHSGIHAWLELGCRSLHNRLPWANLAKAEERAVALEEKK